jgi:hypothetical protein
MCRLSFLCAPVISSTGLFSPIASWQQPNQPIKAVMPTSSTGINPFNRGSTQLLNKRKSALQKKMQVE